MTAALGLLAFDIDGTLEIGEPPGPVPLAMVRRAQELGYLVGSCSDRPAGWQRLTWERAGIQPDFAVLKHLLERARVEHDAAAYTHVAVSDRDRYYADLAGFGFLSAYEVTGQPWATDASGTPIAAADTQFSQSERTRIEGGRALVRRARQVRPMCVTLARIGTEWIPSARGAPHDRPC